MFDAVIVYVGSVTYLHPVLCAAIAFGAVILAAIGRRSAQLLAPVIRAICRLMHFT